MSTVILVRSLVSLLSGRERAWEGEEKSPYARSMSGEEERERGRGRERVAVECGSV